MKRWTKVVIAVLAVGVLALGAGRAMLERRTAAAAASATINKAPPALELAAGDTAAVRRVELARTVEISGSVRAVDSAVVKARVAGEVTRIVVREGDAVKAGQVLAQQDTTELDWRLRQAEQQAATARSQLEIAQRTLTNNKALVAQGFISPTALDTSASTEAGAQATLQAAMAAVELARKAKGDATLKAPIGGLVSQRLVQPGERVPVDARLLEIVDLSRLEIEAALAPEDAAALHIGNAAELSVDGLPGRIAAKVVRINPSAQVGSRAVTVYLSLAPNPALRHGLFARGRILLDRRSALAIPASAVRQEQSQPYVLALQGSQVVRRVLRLGGSGSADGIDVVEVLDGLTEGETVLAGTVGAVRDGTAVRVAAAAPAAAVVAAPVSAASR